MRVAVIGVGNVFGDIAGFQTLMEVFGSSITGAKPFEFTSVIKGDCLSSAVVQIFVV